MSLFRNKFRNETARWIGWDYTTAGSYFITICTKPRHDYFGCVVHGKMELSEIGLIVFDCWFAIPEHFHGVDLGSFVVMPDHFHGILTIGSAFNGGTGHVGTGHAPSLQPRPTKTPRHPNIRPTVGNVVGSFKSAVTKKSGEMGIHGFAWQQRFYDRVIRNEQEYARIEKYILENPKKWKSGK